MKFFTLSVCSVILLQGLNAETEHQVTIPSKKMIQKKPVAEVKTVDAGAVPPPKVAAAKDVDPFSGGTGGFGGERKNRRDKKAEFSIDEGLGASSTDDAWSRILTGAMGGAGKKKGNGKDFGKSIRQMTEEISKNLTKEGGLEKILDHPSIRQATEAFGKAFAAPGKEGEEKGKSLREMTQQIMKDVNIEDMMKGFNPEMLKNLNLDSILKDLPKGNGKKGAAPGMDELMKNFMGGAAAGKKGGKESVDYASILDSILGKDQKPKADARKKVGKMNKDYFANLNMDHFDSSDDDMFDYFGKEDF